VPAPSFKVLFVGLCLFVVRRCTFIPVTPRLQIDRHQKYVSDTPPQCNPICFFLYASTAISFINSRAISFIFLKRPLSSVAAIRFFQDRVLEEEQVGDLGSACLAMHAPSPRALLRRCHDHVTRLSKSLLQLFGEEYRMCALNHALAFFVFLAPVLTSTRMAHAITATALGRPSTCLSSNRISLLFRVRTSNQ
jgi:hypothetical protein